MARIGRVGLKAATAFALVPMLMVFSGGASARSVSGRVGHAPPTVKVTAAKFRNMAKVGSTWVTTPTSRQMSERVVKMAAFFRELLLKTRAGAAA